MQTFDGRLARSRKVPRPTRPPRRARAAVPPPRARCHRAGEQPRERRGTRLLAAFQGIDAVERGRRDLRGRAREPVVVEFTRRGARERERRACHPRLRERSHARVDRAAPGLAGEFGTLALADEQDTRGAQAGKIGEQQRVAVACRKIAAPGQRRDAPATGLVDPAGLVGQFAALENACHEAVDIDPADIPVPYVESHHWVSRHGPAPRHSPH